MPSRHLHVLPRLPALASSFGAVYSKEDESLPLSITVPQGEVHHPRRCSSELWCIEEEERGWKFLVRRNYPGDFLIFEWVKRRKRVAATLNISSGIWNISLLEVDLLCPLWMRCRRDHRRWFSALCSVQPRKLSLKPEMELFAEMEREWNFTPSKWNFWRGNLAARQHHTQVSSLITDLFFQSWVSQWASLGLSVLLRCSLLSWEICKARWLGCHSVVKN